MVKVARGKLPIAVLSVIICLMAFAPATFACDAQADGVVSAYLADLAGGDVAAIEGLVGGNMAKRASAHFRNPHRYGAFLREQYKQVVMTIVSTAQVEDACHVSAEFAYPSGDIESITLVLSTIGGVWKITDEVIYNPE